MTHPERVSVVAALLGDVEPALECVPEGARVGERRLNLVREAAADHAEIVGLLTGSLTGRDLLEQVGREEPAFDLDRRVGHQRPPPAGSSTKQPRISGGSCGEIAIRACFVIFRSRLCACWISAFRHSTTG